MQQDELEFAYAINFAFCRINPPFHHDRSDPIRKPHDQANYCLGTPVSQRLVLGWIEADFCHQILTGFTNLSETTFELSEVRNEHLRDDE